MAGHSEARSAAPKPKVVRCTCCGVVIPHSKAEMDDWLGRENITLHMPARLACALGRRFELRLVQRDS